MRRLTREMESSGYTKPDQDLHAVVVIQYLVDGLGDEVALNKRYEIQELMSKVLSWTCNGLCDGGDIGSGTMNVVCMVLDIRAALNTIIEALEKHHSLEGAVIALETEEGDEVLYPASPNAIFI